MDPLTAVGVGLGVTSSLLGSSEQSAGLEAQAQSLEAQADVVQKRGAAEALNLRSQADQILGQNVASAAGSGVVTSTGSVLDTIEENARNIEMDALTIEQNAREDAAALRYEAAATRQSKPSGLSTLLGAGASGLGAYAMFGGK